MKKRWVPDKSTRVKTVARERIGSPKPGRVIKDSKLREKPKHKNKEVAE